MRTIGGRERLGNTWEIKNDGSDVTFCFVQLQLVCARHAFLAMAFTTRMCQLECVNSI